MTSQLKAFILIFVLLCSCQGEVNYKPAQAPLEPPTCEQVIDAFDMQKGNNVILHGTMEHYNAGNCFFKAMRYPEAEKLMKKVLSLDANHTDAYWVLARIRSKQNLPKEAIRFYSKAIATERNAKIYSSRGVVYERLGMLDSALKDLNISLALDTTYAYDYNNRGRVYSLLLQFDKAQSDFDRSEALNKTNPYLYKNKGLLSLMIGDTNSACIHLQYAKDLGYKDFGNEIDQHVVDSLLSVHCTIE